MGRIDRRFEVKQRDGEERDEKREMEFGDSMRGHDDELG